MLVKNFLYFPYLSGRKGRNITLIKTSGLYVGDAVSLECLYLMEEAAARIAELRSLGVRVAISEVGDEYCPVFRLTTLAFDYAFLDRYATDSLLGDGAERIAGSLVGFLHYLKVKVVAPLLETEEQCAAAEAVGCDGYTVGADFATEEVSADA